MREQERVPEPLEVGGGGVIELLGEVPVEVHTVGIPATPPEHAQNFTSFNGNVSSISNFIAVQRPNLRVGRFCKLTVYALTLL